MYVLPFAPTRALVETTYISPASLPDATYEDDLRGYLGARYGLTAPEVRWRERGAIAMTRHRPASLRQSPRVIHLGLRGGLAKELDRLRVPGDPAGLHAGARLLEGQVRAAAGAAPLAAAAVAMDRAVLLAHLQRHAPAAGRRCSSTCSSACRRTCCAASSSDHAGPLDYPRVMLATPPDGGDDGGGGALAGAGSARGHLEERACTPAALGAAARLAPPPVAATSRPPVTMFAPGRIDPGGAGCGGALYTGAPAAPMTRLFTFGNPRRPRRGAQRGARLGAGQPGARSSEALQRALALPAADGSPSTRASGSACARGPTRSTATSWCCGATSDGSVRARPRRRCPHMGASLACAKVRGDNLVCPWHGLELGDEPHGRWRPLPTHDDGVLVWVQMSEETAHAPARPPTPAPILAPRPARFLERRGADGGRM